MTLTQGGCSIDRATPFSLSKYFFLQVDGRPEGDPGDRPEEPRRRADHQASQVGDGGLEEEVQRHAAGAQRTEGTVF